MGVEHTGVLRMSSLSIRFATSKKEFCTVWFTKVIDKPSNVRDNPSVFILVQILVQSFKKEREHEIADRRSVGRFGTDVIEPVVLLPVSLGMKSTCTKVAQESSVCGNCCYIK
jgi:hypothetical protein